VSGEPTIETRSINTSATTTRNTEIKSEPINVSGISQTQENVLGKSLGIGNGLLYDQRKKFRVWTVGKFIPFTVWILTMFVVRKDSLSGVVGPTLSVFQPFGLR
jgi:hypothetical protein